MSDGNLSIRICNDLQATELLQSKQNYKFAMCGIREIERASKE